MGAILEAEGPQNADGSGVKPGLVGVQLSPGFSSSAGIPIIARARPDTIVFALLLM